MTRILWLTVALMFASAVPLASTVHADLGDSQMYNYYEP